MKERTQKFIEITLWVLGLAVIIFVSCFFGKCGDGTKPPGKDPYVQTDTVKITVPTIRDTVFVRTDTIRYTDTVTDVKIDYHIDTLVKVDTVRKYVTLPITKKTYRDSDYTAVVSGYNPSLDYIETYHKTVIKLVERWRQPRFSIGVGGGYYVTPKGLQPGFGVTLQYNLLHFK